MAAKNPSRGNFLQTLILTALFMLSFQLLCNNGQNQATQTVPYNGKQLSTVAEIRGALLDADQKLLDVTAHTLVNGHNQRIDAEVTAKKLTEEQGRRAKLEVAVLLADAQLKSGIARNESHRVSQAYQTLVPHWTKERTLPGWTDTIVVPSDARSAPTGRMSPAVLYDKVVATLSERNKKDLIWGFIPGGYQLMDGLVAITGRVSGFSFAAAGFFLALMVRAIVFPLSQKQLMFSRYMGQLTPQIKAIKDEYKDEPAEMQKRTMGLYAKYGINPAQGCLPALVQLPLFLTVYQCMLLYQFEFQKGTFLWINEANALKYPKIFAPNLGQQDIILIALYGISMVISTLLQPITDPSQARQQRLMGVGISVLFTFMMFTGAFPVVAGFVLYWTFTNILATAQSIRAYRMPVKPLQEVNTPTGGVIPGGGKWAQRMQKIMENAQAQQAAAAASDPKSAGKNGKPTIIPPAGPATTGRPATHKPKRRK